MAMPEPTSMQWASPRLEVPRVPNPKCPDHCSGRHEVDRMLVCPKCKAQCYRVINHEWFHQDGHWFHSVEPTGSGVDLKGRQPFCGSCGSQCVSE